MFKNKNDRHLLVHMSFSQLSENLTHLLRLWLYLFIKIFEKLWCCDGWVFLYVTFYNFTTYAYEGKQMDLVYTFFSVALHFFFFFENGDSVHLIHDEFRTMIIFSRKIRDTVVEMWFTAFSFQFTVMCIYTQVFLTKCR